MLQHMAIIDFKRPLVLASASEARRALLSGAGLKFIPDAVDIDETPLPGEAVTDYVSRLAEMKANASVPPALDAVIIAVDTAIGLEEKIIGKPRDESHAREILRELSGKTHEVASAIAVRDLMSASIDVEITRTEVTFDALDVRMIDWYMSTGEWRGRAGAYAIQGKGASLVSNVRGCFTNVIGLSMPTLLRMLRRIG